MEDKINFIGGGERQILERVAMGDPLEVKILIERYLKLLFGFSISFAPFSRDQAFQITVTSFAKTLQQYQKILKNEEWLVGLFREGLAECMRTSPTGGGEPLQKEPLKIIREALFRLSSHDKAILLLRDQCHFSFESIAEILGVDIHQSRSACLVAREHLRAAVKEILDKASGADHVV